MTVLMVDKFQRAVPEYEAQQYDGNNAAALNAWADTFDKTGAKWWTKVENGKLFVRLAMGTFLEVLPGNWLLAYTSGDATPPVFMREPADFAKDFVRKAVVATTPQASR